MYSRRLVGVNKWCIPPGEGDGSSAYHPFESNADAFEKFERVVAEKGAADLRVRAKPTLMNKAS